MTLEKLENGVLPKDQEHFRVIEPTINQIVSLLEVDKGKFFHQAISKQISDTDPILDKFIKDTKKFYPKHSWLFSLGVEVLWLADYLESQNESKSSPLISHFSCSEVPLRERITTLQKNRVLAIFVREDAGVTDLFLQAQKALGLRLDFFWERVQNGPKFKAFANGFFQYLGLRSLELNSPNRLPLPLPSK